MRHLQPSSFTDLMSLLPGGVTKDPEMGSVNRIDLRSASGMTQNDDYATAALGTAFVVDGVRLNTDADMQITPDANRTSRISTGKGVDMRSLSTDDIESVEIVRGIPSVEYGELTSGLVSIKRKSEPDVSKPVLKPTLRASFSMLAKALISVATTHGS